MTEAPYAKLGSRQQEKLPQVSTCSDGRAVQNTSLRLQEVVTGEGSGARNERGSEYTLSLVMIFLFLFTTHRSA